MPNRFDRLVAIKGTAVTFHRESSVGLLRCPCLTPEGFRDPLWHFQHPSEPVCNEQGYLPSGDIVEIIVKGMVQPVASTRSANRTVTDFVYEAFGEIQTDDHIGFFPLTWNSYSLDFDNWSKSGDDWLLYDDKHFTVVSSRKIPDPSDSSPTHHWELALRVINVD